MKRLFLSLWCGFAVSVAAAEGLTVRGAVTDAADSSRMPGVLVQVKGVGKRAVTDRQGCYSIEAGANDTLVFHFLGCRDEAIPVAGHSRIDVALTEEQTDPSKVVVITGVGPYGADAGDSPSGTPSGAKERSAETVPESKCRSRCEVPADDPSGEDAAR